MSLQERLAENQNQTSFSGCHKLTDRCCISVRTNPSDSLTLRPRYSSVVAVKVSVMLVLFIVKNRFCTLHPPHSEINPQYSETH